MSKYWSLERPTKLRAAAHHTIALFINAMIYNSDLDSQKKKSEQTNGIQFIIFISSPQKAKLLHCTRQEEAKTESPRQKGFKVSAWKLIKEANSTERKGQRWVSFVGRRRSEDRRWRWWGVKRRRQASTSDSSWTRSSSNWWQFIDTTVGPTHSLQSIR